MYYACIPFKSKNLQSRKLFKKIVLEIVREKGVPAETETRTTLLIFAVNNCNNSISFKLYIFDI